MATKDRQRALARAKLERQMARKVDGARKRRRIQAGIGATLALALIVAGTIWLVVKYGGDDDGADKAIDPTCAYTTAARDKGSIKDVGTPPTKNVPDTGTRDATLKTNFGEIEMELYQADAPCTVNSFTYLAGKKFFDGTKCHRLTTQGLFVMQCGDPFANGGGGPSYQFGTENTRTNDRPPFKVGDVAMARAQDPNSNGSQFFIVYKDSPDLPGDYSLFGHVTKGLDVITDKIVPNGLINETDTSTGQPAPGSGNGEPAKEVKLEQVTVSDTKT